MKILIRQLTKKIILFFTLMAISILLSSFAIASSTDGAINSINKYAWSENVGWINFGVSTGDVHVTDSGLTGYGWISNYGWLNLNPPGSGVLNNGEGILSGSAWGENTGWVDFSAVTIDSDGYFSGYASGTVTGQISFNCSNTSSCEDSDFKVQTDWRPQSARPACNNATDDDNDGLTDYPNDLGCESLEDDNEVNPGVGFFTAASVSSESDSKFKILINNGDKYTNNTEVKLKLFGARDTNKFAVSQDPDFKNSTQQIYKPNDSGFQILNFKLQDFKSQVYAKFYTKSGQPSQIVSDSIILDTTPPELQIDKPKDYYTENESIILTGKTEKDAEIISHWNKKYGLSKADANGNLKINLGKMPAGNYILELTPKDLAGNTGQVIATVLDIKPVAAEKEEIEPSSDEAPEGEEEIEKTEKEDTTVIEKIEEVAEKIEETTEKIIDKIIDIIVPKEEEKVEPKEEEIITVPERAPLALKEKWNLLPEKAIKRFVLGPLPKEFQKLTDKFPELGETFQEVGVQKITDLKKLTSIKLTLPGLTKRATTFKGKIETGKFAPSRAIPLAELSPQLKKQLPTEIVFAKTGGELIDFNITLTVDDKGRSQQKINTISGKPLHLVIKPEHPVKSIKGYLVFKSTKKQTRSINFSLTSLVSSLIFSNPVFAYSQEKPVRVEEKLVLMEFEYTDPDGDGLYTAEIQTPLVEGEYEIITVMDFEDPELGRKEIRLITVIDPEGYVYESAKGKEIRIPGAIVSIYTLNPQNKQYGLWPAPEYQQENPQITNNTGKYSFLVPEGFYYLKVDAPGYIPYEGKPFEVKEGSGIHKNIELKTKYWFLKVVDLKTTALIIVILLLIYNFYKDKKREQNK